MRLRLADACCLSDNIRRVIETELRAIESEEVEKLPDEPEEIVLAARNVNWLKLITFEANQSTKQHQEFVSTLKRIINLILTLVQEIENLYEE